MPKMNRLTMVMLAVALLPLLVLPSMLFGQAASSISGSVMDTSKAVLPGSAVEATNTATGIKTSATTNNAGVYNFPSLQPGVYKVTVEAKGFQTASKTDVKLGMASQIRLDFEMQVSGGSTEIEVSTSAENMTLEAGSSTGTVLQEESVTQLPLASNDVMDLINVMGGVVKAEDPIFSNSSQTFAGVAAGNVNIQRDGITVNEVRYNSGIVSPIRINQEMVGEFKMVLSPVDAEMGRGAGQVQILTKSGSNQFHGSGVWNVQNTALDANEWYLKRDKNVPAWRNLNNYTLSASGPLIKNKTFFFATWDQQIVRSKTYVKSRVLTDCARKGIYRYLASPDTNIGIANSTGITPYNYGIPTRPTVWRAGLNSDVSNPDGYNYGDPLLNYTGTLPSGVPAIATLRYQSVIGELTQSISNINTDCSDYSPDFYTNNVLTGINGHWDKGNNRVAVDSTGYVRRFNGMMPPANDFTAGDGLNVAAHGWTRVLQGSDTVFGSGEDNQRKSITVKLDHNINNAHRASGTYTYESDYGDDAYRTWPEAYGGYGGAVDRQPQSFTVTLTSTLKPTLLNEFRMGLSRTRTHTNEPLNNPKTGAKMRKVLDELNQDINTPNYTGDPMIIGLGTGSTEMATDTMTMFFTSSSSHPYGSRGNLPATSGGVDPRWSFSDTVTWTRGAHSFKGGFEMRIAKSWQESNGAFGFVGSANTFPSIKGGVLSGSPLVADSFCNTVDGACTKWIGMAGVDSATPSGNYSGAYDLMNYMVGSVGTIRQYFYVNSATSKVWNDASKGELNQIVDLRGREMSAFFKDDWKLNSSLTLNLGFRWEYYGVPYTASGMTAAINGGTDKLFRGGSFSTWLKEKPAELGDLAQYDFVGPNSPNPDQSPWKKDLNNFAPHVGFAWNLPWFGKGKTTMRGGYSVSYSPVNNYDGYATALAKVPGTTYSFQYQGGTMGTVTPDAYLDLSKLANLIPLVPSSTVQPLLPRYDNDRGVAITVYDENIRNPYVQSLNLSLTRNVGNNLTVDVRYIATLSRKSISGININQPDYYTNGLYDAFVDVRAGKESALLNALIGKGLHTSATPAETTASTLLRSYSSTRTNLATGNFSALASTLSTMNGTWSGADAPAGTNGAVLRHGCLPSQLVNNVCQGNTPENFIYTSPQYSSATINKNLGHSNYHSLQAQLTMRPTRGVSFQTTYTWSRNLADQGWNDFREGAARDYYLSSQHRSHQLTSYGTFDLPFGANGFIFRNATGAFKKAVEGWQISWIASLTSGVPGSITGVSRLWGASNVQLERPDLWDNKAGKVTWANKANQGYFFGNKRYVIGNDPQCFDTTIVAASLNSVCQNGTFGPNMKALYLDTNSNGAYNSGDTLVFRNADAGTRGNYGMNTLTGPGRWSLDMAMGKAIEFMEGKKIDFRIDAQNIFNHPTPSNSSTQWNPRFTSIGNPSFAMNSNSEFGVLGTKGGHRTFQAKIRISF